MIFPELDKSYVCTPNQQIQLVDIYGVAALSKESSELLFIQVATTVLKQRKCEVTKLKV